MLNFKEFQEDKNIYGQEIDSPEVAGKKAAIKRALRDAGMSDFEKEMERNEHLPPGAQDLMNITTITKHLFNYFKNRTPKEAETDKQKLIKFLKTL